MDGREFEEEGLTNNAECTPSRSEKERTLATSKKKIGAVMIESLRLSVVKSSSGFWSFRLRMIIRMRRKQQ